MDFAILSSALSFPSSARFKRNAANRGLLLFGATGAAALVGIEYCAPIYT
jgi:hypothetical protein